LAERIPGVGTRLIWFVRRTAAWLVDQVLINGAAWGISLILLFLVHLLKGALGGPAMSYEFFVAELNGLMLQGFNAVVTIAVASLVHVWMTVKTGTTPGRWLVRLEVCDHRTGGRLSIAQAWRRFFASALSYLPFLTGYLMAAFQREGRALHDLIADTRVVPVLRKA